MLGPGQAVEHRKPSAPLHSELFTNRDGLLMDTRLLWTKTRLGKDAPCANQAAALEGGQQSHCTSSPCLPNPHQA